MTLYKILSACVFALITADAAVIRHSNSSDKRANCHEDADLIHLKAKWLSATSFTKIHSHTTSQCWQKLATKVTYAVKHRQSCTIISNMSHIAAVSEIERSDGKMRTHFEESPVASTYLPVGLLASDLRNANDSDGTINVWSRGDAISSPRFAHGVDRRAAIESERYANRSVAVPKIDHVALPVFYQAEVVSDNLGTGIQPIRKIPERNLKSTETMACKIHSRSRRLLNPSSSTNTMSREIRQSCTYIMNNGCRNDF